MIQGDQKVALRQRYSVRRGIFWEFLLKRCFGKKQFIVEVLCNMQRRTHAVSAQTFYHYTLIEKSHKSNMIVHGEGPQREWTKTNNMCSYCELHFPRL